MSATDQELFIASQAGDARAFGALVRRHESLAFAVAVAAMRTTSGVEDVIQETFVAAWLQRQTLREPAKFKAWVCAIARNQAANVRRRDRNRMRHANSLTVARVGSAEDEYLERESKAELDAALAATPQKYREVLVLFYSEEQSIRRVALSLGLSEAAAQKRISRARQAVKQSLTSVLKQGLPGSKSALGVSSAVLSQIASQENAVAATLTSAPGGISSALSKGTYSIGAFATVVIGLGLGLQIVGDRNPATASPAKKSNTQLLSTSTNASKRLKSPAEDRPSAIGRRISQEERAQRFARHSKRTQTDLQATNPEQLLEELESFDSDEFPAEFLRKTREVHPLLAECLGLARIFVPELHGRITLEMEVSDEAEIAGLVTSVSVERREGKFNPPNDEFEECVRETLFSLEFSAPSRGIPVIIPFVFPDQDGTISHASLSKDEFVALVSKVSDPEQLANLSEEYMSKLPEHALGACRKAVTLDDAGATGYACTLVACELAREESALSFWGSTHEVFRTGALRRRADEACAKSNVSLP